MSHSLLPPVTKPVVGLGEAMVPGTQAGSRGLFAGHSVLQAQWLPYGVVGSLILDFTIKMC